MAINYHNHNINTSGTITSASGNFTTLVVNGTSVSNFNSSVSGLLPTIANSGDNRILTSTGSSVGINAEANLTFDGSTLGIIGNVGAGTSSPTQRLQVHGSSGDDVYLRISNTDTTTASGLLIGLMGTEDAVIRVEPNKALTFGTNNTERMRITSGGNLEIKSNAGNISTLFTYNENGGELVHYDDAQVAATLLDQCNNQTRLLELINGSDLLLGLGGSNSTGSIRFMRAGFNEAMTITSGGNVGIGIATPTLNTNGTVLHIHNSTASRASMIRFTNNESGATATDGLMVGKWSDGTNYVYDYDNYDLVLGAHNGNKVRIHSVGTSFYQSANGTPALGSKNFYAATFENLSAGYGLAIGGVNASTGSAFLQVQNFSTATAYDLLLQPLGGNVGIGTTSPSTKLQINGQTRVTDGTTNIDFVSSSAVGYIGTQTNHPLVLRTNDTEKMRITSAGNVGIGGTAAATPPELLSVMQDNNGGRTSILIDNSDQRLKMSCYYEFGVGQYSEIQSTNNAETGHQGLILNRQGGNVAIGTATASYRLHVVGNASAVNNVVCYLNNTGGTRSRLAFQDTAVTYAPDMGSVGNSLTFDTLGVERVRIGNNGRTQFFAATEKYCVQLNNGSTGNGPFIGSDGADIFCISASGGAERLRVNAAGELLIGTTTDNGAYLLQVNSQIYATNATIATSDSRFKTNIVSINNATSIIQSLRPVSFDFIPQTDRNFSSDRQIGLIAQEVQEVLSNTDYKDSIVAHCGDHFGLAYEKLVPLLIKALQETNQELQHIKNRLSLLERE